MLPSARKYFEEGGLSPGPAAYAVIGCFLAGAVGIQFISRLIHHFIPSHVVDCDHTHEEHKEDDTDDHPNENPEPEDEQAHRPDSLSSEDTPLLSRETNEDFDFKPRITQRSMSAYGAVDNKPSAAYLSAPKNQRPNFQTRLTGLVSGIKTLCDQNGPCHGYSDPCAQDCFKVVSRNPAVNSTRNPPTGSRRQSPLLRSTTDYRKIVTSTPQSRLYGNANHRSSRPPIRSEESKYALFRGHFSHQPNGHGYRSGSEHYSYDLESQREGEAAPDAAESNPPNDPVHDHHHHVPTNAFLSIGLQTSIAIALHKLPEGFITYATNHANPRIGFSVFMALFIHNITEGFAMALPLYLAINSRWKAMFWSSLLGGFSQPIGAGIAALTFKAAGRMDHAPDKTIYGCMFAITSGIMASVALQLFSESLVLTHNRTLCIAFAFLGMGVLGFSSALTAG